MNIADGFQLEQPDTFIPWGIDEERLKELITHGLRHVTEGYYTISGKSLGGLEHMLGFHFTPRKCGQLLELEFFRSEYSSWDESFRDFQNRFEAKFGKPTSVEPGSEKWPSNTWELPGATITHCIFDRFGLEEHMTIQARYPTTAIGR
ncbi:MAG: hypothetical protein AAF750_18325 [Planctomycetota bacterium]